MPGFRGSSWQRGYGQTSYGLGGLFCSLGKIAKPMIKSGAKALRNIALTSGVVVAEWFDSYGKPPELYGPALTEFLNKHCERWAFNDHKLQSDWSDVCGHYCIFYLGHRACEQSMKKIVQLFGEDTVLNHSKVLWFVKTHFRVALKQPSVGFVQCCKKLIQ